MSDRDANIFGGKTRLQVFLDRFLPADFECGDISITFNENGSAYVTIGSPYRNKTDDEDDHD